MGVLLNPRSSQRMTDSELARGGYVQEANRRFFHILDLELVSLVGNEGLELQIWKGQSFGSGLIFGKQDEEWSPVRQERARWVDEFWAEQAGRRLGWAKALAHSDQSWRSDHESNIAPLRHALSTTSAMRRSPRESTASSSDFSGSSHVNRTPARFKPVRRIWCRRRSVSASHWPIH